MVVVSFWTVFVRKTDSSYVDTVYDNDTPKALAELVQEIRGAQHDVHIVGGNPSNEVYASEDFEEAVEEATGRVEGPVTIEAVFTDSPEKPLAESPVGKLAAKNPRFHLYGIDLRPSIHFRIIDSTSARPLVYVEEPHEEEAHRRTIRIVRGAAASADMLENRFETAKRRAKPVPGTAAAARA